MQAPCLTLNFDEHIIGMSGGIRRYQIKPHFGCNRTAVLLFRPLDFFEINARLLSLYLVHWLTAIVPFPLSVFYSL